MRTVPAGGTDAGRIDGIQILRALAALCVAFLHIEQAAGAFVGRPGESPWPWLHAFPWEAGVDVFFVISGFVMAYASAPLFGSWRAVRPFLARRIARVVPLYWLVTTLTLLIGAALPGALNDPVGGGVRTVLASYAFIPWPRPDGSMEPVFRLGWTLNAEMFFYVIFAALLSLKRRTALAALVAVILGLVAAGRFFPPATPVFAFWTDPILIEFAFGVALGALRLEGARLGGAARFALAVAGLATLTAVSGTLAWRPLSYGIPSACFVAAFALPAREPRPSRIGRIWLTLGDASYALYLVHLFPMRALREVFVRFHLSDTNAIFPFITLGLAASCVVAVLVNRMIERPLTRRVRAALGA